MIDKISSNKVNQNPLVIYERNLLHQATKNITQKSIKLTNSEDSDFNLNKKMKLINRIQFAHWVQKMQNEVVLLRQKVKDLQRELCDRTRNYLYHFKKSPVKKNNTLVESQTQTDVATVVEEGTQQNSIQESHFANISIDSYNHLHPLPREGHLTKLQQKTDPILIKNSPNDDLQHYSSHLFTSNNPISEETHQIQISSLTKEIENMKNELQSTKTPQRYHQYKVEILNFLPRCQTPLKDSESNEFSKKKEIETIDELSESRFNGQSSGLSSIQQDNYVKEIKILKKEIKKLKNHLETQLYVSSQTKQALLISEQENYKFRLQIQKLNKQIQILKGVFSESELENSKPFSLEDYEASFKQVDSDQSQSTKQELEKYKNQSQKYAQHISILQGVKRDYLKRCIEAKEQICRLKQQKELLRTQNRQLKILVRKQQDINPNNGQFSQKISSEWIEVLGSKIHQISNCLPLMDNHEQFLFMPDNIDDMISMLERILSFCKNIEIWEKQRIQCIQKQRANLLKILSSVLMKHPESKQTIAEEIFEIEELKYLVSFMNKQPKSPVRFGQNLSLQGIIEQSNYSNTVSMN